ncbi:P-loop containing nucleoside triphosphate hydrolase protein [Dioscorea alata]|uniref:P-loop containing nucleoside triphosphate hydrolase protein n=1 Tax=Dioscorea alata TaxID=55571 RepID=A0ACB7WMD8_DIOAL|nr:P-loop containing nucleoside triphosphate hydrolase protein [Dioscorea alata]
MAEAAVGFLVQKLSDLLVQEAINLHEVRGEVEWLKEELEAMQCFLKDADAKKNKEDGESVKNWVTKMRDVAFEAEDIIDTFMYYELRRQQPGFIKRFVFIFDELISRHKGHVDVEGIKTKLRDLSEKRSLYGIANTTSQSRSPGRIPILPQLPDDIDMVGFDDEKKKIVLELLDRNNANRSLISIVGMGGLGKTTLAKSVYNDHKVKRSFNIFAWVIISQEYTILEILKGILSEKSETSPEDTIQTLSVKVFEKLGKGKYLVVLDDVWNENVWNELLKVFPDDNNGSRVIITTRNLNVAKIADPTIQPHELRLLNEKESKELFLRKVFPRQDIKTCCPTYLVEYAHQLVQRCGGLPLALVVLGGLVSTKPQTKDAWQKVVESMREQFVEDGKRLWSAEGFLPTKNDKTIEEFGFNCLEELAQRCLIQVTVGENEDRSTYCRIHDLLRDMCIAEAKENKFLEIYQNDTANCATMANAARRLIIFNEIEMLNYSNSNLRGLFYGHVNLSLSFIVMKGQLGRFKLLRVLRLMAIVGMSKFPSVSEFPSEIKSLIHLRYLEMAAHNWKEVPSWIGDLYNLQTLIIYCNRLGKISDSLWTIDNLRHVDLSLSYITDPPNMRNNVPKNLQTLKWLRAGSWIGKTLPKLTNLCELRIHGVSNDHADVLSSSLQKLGRLAFLHIKGHEIPSDNIITAFPNQHCLKKLHLRGELNCKKLPNNGVFPQQLVELYLESSKLEHDPMPTLEKLQCLKYLYLRRAYTGKQMICSARGFPQLSSLHIESLDELEEWTIEDNAMSCLKSLLIKYCPRLKMIPEGLKNVPLDQAKLITRRRELTIRLKKNIEKDWYKIQVPNIFNGDY